VDSEEGDEKKQALDPERVAKKITRMNTMMSMKKEEEKKEQEDLITEEEKIEGGISYKDYKDLASFSLGQITIWLYWFVNLMATVLQLAPSYIIAAWVNLEFKEQQLNTTYPMLFGATIFGFIFLGFLRALLCVAFMLQASTNMHNTMAQKVLRANILFFDSNPIGRVITRFSKDMMIIDAMLPMYLVFLTAGLLRTFSVVAACVAINYWLAIPLLFGCIAIYRITDLGLAPMIEAQRHEQISYGPINSTMNMLVSGIVTLRSYRKFDFFKIKFNAALESSANATFCFIAAGRWVAIRIDLIGMTFAFCTACLAVALRNTIERRLLTMSL
jgi:ABC-type multidrug transport system fused ATPase/permease subunit